MPSDGAFATAVAAAAAAGRAWHCVGVEPASGPRVHYVLCREKKKNSRDLPQASLRWSVRTPPDHYLFTPELLQRVALPWLLYAAAESCMNGRLWMIATLSVSADFALRGRNAFRRDSPKP